MASKAYLLAKYGAAPGVDAGSASAARSADGKPKVKVVKRSAPKALATAAATSVRVIDEDDEAEAAWKRRFAALDDASVESERPALGSASRGSKRARPAGAPGGSDGDGDMDPDEAAIVAHAMAEARQNKFRKPQESGWVTVAGTSASGAGPEREGDLSPPRRHQRSPSPKAQPRMGAALISSASDLSPPRRRRSPSPGARPRAGGAVAANAGDLSPPRRRRSPSPGARPRAGGAVAASAGDLSPPRRRRSPSPGAGPRTGGAVASSAGDLSPPRRRRSPSPDLPQRSTVTTSAARLPALSSASSASPMDRTATGQTNVQLMESGARAGLQSGAAIREDADRRRQLQQEKFARMDPTQTGRNAETVYRDKAGAKVDVKLERAQKMAERRAQLEAEERDMEWGKGLVQKREREEKLLDMQREAAKPFARRAERQRRHADDEDLNARLRDQQRWGDPMANLVKKKDGAAIDRPKYRGPPPPPNRFNIAPGYRWDGVDRSNGFERTLLSQQTSREARELDAYLWSVQDM